MLSGSSRNPKSRWNEPTGIHSHSVRTYWRSSSGCDIRSRATTQLARKLPATATVPTMPATGSPMRLPNATRTTNPASGNAGMSQTISIAQPLISEMSSTVAPWRRRMMATMIPNPTTTSDAATTSTKNTTA